ncbi:hypothetical protein SELMODRAFT_407073 [Selaginella moellendorffii]|uniref:Uncharacterized protein n=1 Tax=Selaginella moellendorffii TaxID=88036 RepID=D8R3U2_SELML|nr:hypothetical protein SELMODRAFT_407073 [Selaginella moellendorffii]
MFVHNHAKVSVWDRLGPHQEGAARAAKNRKPTIVSSVDGADRLSVFMKENWMKNRCELPSGILTDCPSKLLLSRFVVFREVEKAESQGDGQRFPCLTVQACFFSLVFTEFAGAVMKTRSSPGILSGGIDRVKTTYPYVAVKKADREHGGYPMDRDERPIFLGLHRNSTLDNISIGFNHLLFFYCLPDEFDNGLAID